MTQTKKLLSLRSTQTNNSIDSFYLNGETLSIILPPLLKKFKVDADIPHAFITGKFTVLEDPICITAKDKLENASRK